MAFKVATYNILATAYIKLEWYEGVSTDLLTSTWRVPALVKHVVGLGSDIICMQEVEVEVFKALDLRLGSLGYAGRYEQKGRGKPDGCATFYREDLFTLRQARRLEYHDSERGPDEHSGLIALLLAFDHAGRLLGVANTHLRWDKSGTPREQQIGYRQAMELVEECQQFNPKCGDWIICGDFNRTPNTEVVAAMQEADFEFAHADRPHVRSAVANGRAKMIDYLFHTGNLCPRPLDPMAIRDDTKLPSAGQPSDHLALVAEFDWIKKVPKA